MRSIIVTAPGGPEVLQLQEVPIPAINDNEVLVRVKTAGINYADIMQRVGLYPNGPQPPFGAGFEVCGLIEKCGKSVRQWKPGDPVMGFCSNGYSDFVVADPRALMRKPDQLDFVQSAAIPCQFLTAYHVLITLGRLKTGQTVLIQAAAGGVGIFLVQIARNIGATSIGTASSEEKLALVHRLGCQYPINYIEKDFQEEVMKITTTGCDLAVESVGGQVFDKTLRCVKPRGQIIVIGAASGKPRGVQTIYLLANNLTVAGFHLMAYASDVEAMANAQRDLNQWLKDGRIDVIVNHVFPLEQAAEAQQMISERKTTGKVVLKVSD